MVVGGARGADWIAERLARRRGLAVEVYPARWDEEGKCAGFRRNVRMLDLPGVRTVLAFRTGGRDQPGRRHTHGRLPTRKDSAHAHPGRTRTRTSHEQRVEEQP